MPAGKIRALYGQTGAALRKEARASVRGFGKSKVIYRRAMQEGVFDPEHSGLSAESCASWRAHYHFALPEVASVVYEQALNKGALLADGSTPDDTAKAVIRLHDGLEVEMVRIPMGRNRHSLCISSQVGCKMGCTFCETGRMGLLRHLSAEEIVAQLLVAKHTLKWTIRNIVFMGMGEALDNPDAVVSALRVFNDPAGLAISQERMTVCTVGNIDGIKRLADEGMTRLGLSVSINSAIDEQRNKIMPINRAMPLSKLQAVLQAYRPRKNFTLGVNVCLMPGINDSERDVRAVADFCRPLSRVLVNVIPYNPGGAPISRAPSEAEVELFIEQLRGEGLAVRRRITKGRSVMAACGQLGNVGLRDSFDRKKGVLKVL